MIYCFEHDCSFWELGSEGCFMMKGVHTVASENAFSFPFYASLLQSPPFSLCVLDDYINVY